MPAAREDVRVSVKARLAGTTLEIGYDARRTLVTGMGPRPGGEGHGVARLDLASGRVAIDRDARLASTPLAVPAPAAAGFRPARFHARDPDATIVLGGPPPDVEGVLSTGDDLVGFERAPGRVVVHRWRAGDAGRSGRGRTVEIAAEADAIWVTLDRRHVALRRARDQRMLDVHALDTGAPLATGLAGAVDLAVVSGRLFWTSLGSRGEVILSAAEPRSGGAAWRRVLLGPPPPAGEPIP